MAALESGVRDSIAAAAAAVAAASLHIPYLIISNERRGFIVEVKNQHHHKYSNGLDTAMPTEDPSVCVFLALRTALSLYDTAHRRI